ncbi:hypothetical protein TorRG33x02_309900, partial [Trema orientale]
LFLFTCSWVRCWIFSPISSSSSSISSGFEIGAEDSSGVRVVEANSQHEHRQPRGRGELGF